MNSIFTEASLESENRSREVAETLIDMVEGFVIASPHKFAIALSPPDVREHFSKGLISLPMGMENGSPNEGDLANVQHFYDRGIRYRSTCSRIFLIGHWLTHHKKSIHHV